MENIKFRGIAALALGCALASCGGGGATGGAPVKLEELGSKTAEASCAKMFMCCTDAEIMMLSMGGPPVTDEASCRQVYGGFIMAFFYPSIMDSTAKSRSVYDGAKLGACLAKIRGLTCAEYSSSRMAMSGSTGSSFGVDDESCRTWLTPKVAKGGACRYDFECLGGEKCVGANSGMFGGMAMDGACGGGGTSMFKDGDPCPMDFNCGANFYCDGTVQPPTCRALKADGADCNFGGFCQSGRCVMGKCAPKAADGETCGSGMECQSGYCEGGNMGAGTCKPPKADGEACMSSTECKAGQCSNGKCGSGGAQVKCSGR